MREPHYFEDFAAGQVFRSGPYRMERDAIIAFAREFDPQPQHLGEAEAARSQFGQLVASGWHTAAVTMRLFIQDALPPIAGGGQGLGLENLVWVRPVRVSPVTRFLAAVVVVVLPEVEVEMWFTFAVEAGIPLYTGIIKVLAVSRILADL